MSIDPILFEETFQLSYIDEGGKIYKGSSFSIINKMEVKVEMI
jgi:hypothetical protein